MGWCCFPAPDWSFVWNSLAQVGNVILGLVDPFLLRSPQSHAHGAPKTSPGGGSWACPPPPQLLCATSFDDQ